MSETVYDEIVTKPWFELKPPKEVARTRIYNTTWLDQSELTDAICRRDPDAFEATLKRMPVHDRLELVSVIRGVTAFTTGLGDGVVVVGEGRFKFNEVTQRLERVR